MALQVKGEDPVAESRARMVRKDRLVRNVRMVRMVRKVRMVRRGLVEALSKPRVARMSRLREDSSALDQLNP